MERITVKCPNCENRMEIDPKVIAFRCSKCGEKINLDDEPVKQSSILANINVDRKETVKIDKADLLRAKNEYKLEKKRIRQQDSGLPSHFSQRNKTEVVYRDRKVGFGAAVVGVVKWFMIGLTLLLIVSEISNKLK